MGDIITAIERIEKGKTGEMLDLRGLQLTGDDLNKLVDKLRTHPIERIDLSNNQIEYLPGAFCSLTHLIGLDLNGNLLKKLPGEIGNMVNLANLDLGKNQLSELPEEITNLTNLLGLALCGNKFKALPEHVTRLSRLMLLVLSENEIMELPETIANLDQLRYLKLENNRLQYLPDVITKMSNLTQLVVNDNRLSVLPERMAALAALETLSIERNPLSILTRARLRTIQADSRWRLKIEKSPVSPQQRWLDVFEKEKDEALALVDGLDLGTPQNDNGIGRLPSQFIEEIMEKIPDNELEASAFIYMPALQEIRKWLFDDSLSADDKILRMEQLAIITGSCATPVKDYLTGMYVKQKLGSISYEELNLTDQRLIEREALQDWILQQPELLGNGVEKIEAVQGFLNAVYLKKVPLYVKSSSDGDIPTFLSIDREPCYLRAKTVNFQFANSQITEDMAVSFVEKLCLGRKLTDAGIDEGYITIDPKKLNAIKEEYLETIGHPTALAREIHPFVAAYKRQMQERMDELDLFTVNLELEDGNLIDVEAHSKELKEILRHAENREYSFNEFITGKKAELEKLAAKYKSGQEAESLQMGIPTVNRKRNNSGDDDRTGDTRSYQNPGLSKRRRL